MANVAAVNRTLLYLDLVLLLFVVAIPFATATMAEFLTLGGQDARVAMALYAVALEGMGLSFGAIFEWTLRSDRVHQPIPQTARRAARLRFSIGSVLYLAAIPVAFVSPPAALAIIAAVAIYYIFERTPDVGPAADRQGT